MSASLSSMDKFYAAFAESVPNDIHPSGRAVIHEWLGDMRDAIERNDPHEYKRLAGMVTRKIAQERQWERENRSKGEQDE